MQYMCLIYGDPERAATMTEEEGNQVFADYNAFTESIRESGHLVGGDALHPVETATTVRVRDGEALVTDGPFAETKEQLGGYYLIDVDNLDDALAAAARCPGALGGTMEVRPVQVFDDEGNPS
jgi:hypothetical protein